MKRDLTGLRFGKLTAVGPTPERKHDAVVCRSDCGNQAEVSQYNLQGGQISCGCIQNQWPGLHFVDGIFGERIQSDHLSRANTSGIRGVYFNKKRGKCYYLGGYADIQEAAKARPRAEEEIFGNCLKWYQEIYGDVSEKEMG